MTPGDDAGNLMFKGSGVAMGKAGSGRWLSSQRASASLKSLYLKRDPVEQFARTHDVGGALLKGENNQRLVASGA
jgi:hypothetical protein